MNDGGSSTVPDMVWVVGGEQYGPHPEPGWDDSLLGAARRTAAELRALAARVRVSPDPWQDPAEADVFAIRLRAEATRLEVAAWRATSR